MTFRLDDLPAKDAYTVNAHAERLPDDNYYSLIRESAALLVSRGHGVAEYRGGWTTKTLWEYNTATNRLCSIVAQPHVKVLDVQYMNPRETRIITDIVKGA